MKLFKLFIFLIFALGLFQKPGFTEIYSKIKGRVVDEETKKGIHGVTVNVHYFIHDNPLDFYVKTDKDGYFTFSNLKSGQINLNYYPPYPYVSVPTREPLKTDSLRSFILKEGEIKHVEQKLKKGGMFTLECTSNIVNLSEYSRDDSNFDKIEDSGLSYNIITLSEEKLFDFKSGRLHGIEAGEYILSIRFSKHPKYYAGNDIDLAGIVTIFSVEKLENKLVNIEYNFNSRLVFNSIKDNNNNFYISTHIYIYKKINLKGKIIYFKIWDKYYSPYTQPKIIFPVMVEPGSYLIDIRGELKNSDNTTIKFESNYFLVEVNPDEEKKLDLVVLISGKDIPDEILEKMRH